MPRIRTSRIADAVDADLEGVSVGDLDDVAGVPLHRPARARTRPGRARERASTWASGRCVCPTRGTGADPVHGQGLDSQASPSPSASRRCGSPGPAPRKNACAVRLRGEVAAVHVDEAPRACAGTTLPTSAPATSTTAVDSSRAMAVSRRRMGDMLTRRCPMRPGNAAVA